MKFILQSLIIDNNAGTLKDILLFHRKIFRGLVWFQSDVYHYCFNLIKLWDQVNLVIWTLQWNAVYLLYTWLFSPRFPAFLFVYSIALCLIPSDTDILMKDNLRHSNSFRLNSPAGNDGVWGENKTGANIVMFAVTCIAFKFQKHHW